MRGATIWFALAFALHCLPVSHAMRRCDDPRPDDQTVPGTMPAAHEAAAGLPRPPGRARPEFSYGHPNPAWRPPEFATDNDIQALAKIFRFQAATKHAISLVGPDEGVNYVCKSFQDEVFPEHIPMRVIPVSPQPSVDFVALLDVPSWITDLLLVPVLIEIQGETVTRYMDIFCGKVNVDFLRLSAGDKWLQGGLFFVGDENSPASEDDIIQLWPGTLIRLLWPDRHCVRCRPLSEKILQPQRFFRQAHELPEEVLCDGAGCIGLVGTWGDWGVLRTSASMTTQHLRQAIAATCGVAEGNFAVVAPASQPPDLSFRGERTRSLLAVVPKALEDACFIFLDARELGVPVRAITLPPLCTTLSTVLRLAGGTRPWGLNLVVEGASDYSAANETFYPVNKALIRVKVASPEVSDEYGSPSTGRAQAWREDKHCPPAVSPVLPFPSNAPSDQTACGGHHGPLMPQTLAVLDAEEKIRFQNQLANSKISSAVVDKANDHPLPRAEEGQAHPLVFRDDEAPDESDVPEGLDVEDVEEWSIHVQVFAFQRAVCDEVLWISRHDDLASVMVRARILLAPTDGSHLLYLPNPQPFRDRLSFLLAPAWWDDRDLKAVLVAGANHAEPPFANVAAAEDDVASLLPPSLQATPLSVDVYLSGTDGETHAQVSAGDLLYMQASDEPAPYLPTAAAVIANPRIERRLADIPDPPRMPGNRFLLLGSGFEQQLVEVPPGAIAPHVAAALDEPLSALHLWFQSEPFANLAFCGRPVRRCIGFRFKALHSVAVGVAIFIGARLLGKPVCCRWLNNSDASARNIAEAIGFAVPDGFQLQMCVGEHVLGPEVAVRLRHCASVALRAVSISWSTMSVPGTANAAEDRELPDDSDEEADDGSPSGLAHPPRAQGTPSTAPHEGGTRSRSPRRASAAPAAPTTQLQVKAFVLDVQQPRGRCVPTPCRSTHARPTFTALCQETCSPLPANMWSSGSATCALPLKDTPVEQELANVCSLPLHCEDVYDQAGFETLLALARRPEFDRTCARACALLQAVPWNDAPDLEKLGYSSFQPLVIQLVAIVPPPPLLFKAAESPKMHEADHFSFGQLSLGFGLPELRRLLLCSVSLVGICEILAMSDAETAAWFRARPCITTCELDTPLACFTDGSYTPATSTEGPLMGWAVAFFQALADSLPNLTCIGVASGMVPPILWGDHEAPSAFMAECVALCMALLADMMHFPGQPRTFVTDCKAALDCANGAASSGSMQVQGVMRSLAMLRRASSRGPVQLIHTHSHKGEFANELVDTASKLASRGSCLQARPFPFFVLGTVFFCTWNSAHPDFVLSHSGPARGPWAALGASVWNYKETASRAYLSPNDLRA